MHKAKLKPLHSKKSLAPNSNTILTATNESINKNTNQKPSIKKK